MISKNQCCGDGLVFVKTEPNLKAAHTPAPSKKGQELKKYVANLTQHIFSFNIVFPFAIPGTVSVFHRSKAEKSTGTSTLGLFCGKLKFEN